MKKRIFILLTLLSIVSFTGCICDKVTLTPEELIKNMQEGYGNLNTFHEKTTSEIINYAKAPEGQKTTASTELFYKKGNIYSLRSGDGVNTITIKSNGLLTSFSTEKEPEPDIKAISLPLSKLYQRISAKSLITPERFITEYYLLDKKIPAGDMVESQTIEPKYISYDGSKCYKLTIKLKTKDSQTLWIDTKDFTIKRNLITIASPDSAKINGKASETHAGERIPAGTMLISDEKLTVSERNQPIDETVFKIAEPSGNPPKKETGSTSQSYNTLTGKKAPSFMLIDDSGRKVSPENYKGENLIIVFWDPIYRKSTNEIKEIYKSAQKHNTKIIAITEEKNKEVRLSELQAISTTITSLYDGGGKISALYQVDVIPYTVVIDKNGNIKQSFAGNHSREQVEKALQNQTL